MVGTHVDILRGYQFAYPVEGVLQQCPSRGEEVYELLGLLYSTAWPESPASSACENDTVVVIIFCYHK